MNNIIKEKEKNNSFHNKNEKSLSETIWEIIKNELVSDNKKIPSIEEEVILYLDNNGIFIAFEWKINYFDRKNNNLYNIEDKTFKYFLSNLTKLNMANSIFKYCIGAIKSHSYTFWRKINLKRFSYYNEIDNSLYVYNNDSIIHISEHSINNIDNGYNDIIFEKNYRNEKWDFIKNVNRKKDYIKELINSMNFKDGILNMEEIEIIIKYYIYSLFFPELFEWKVIINVIWDMGSGKSFFFSTLLKIFYWKKTKLIPFPKSEKNFYTILMNNYLVFFDNVDINTNSIKSKLDIIANASTWWVLKWNGDNWKQFEWDISANLGINSMEPNLNRRDISDRSIILELERKRKYTSWRMSQNNYVDNRNIILSMICYTMQDILKNIRKYKEYETDFRISDFSTFVLNNFKDDEEKIHKIFKKLIKVQQQYTNENEPLPNLIENILEEKESPIKKWVFYSSKELHIIFIKYSKKHNYIVKYPHKEVRSLAKVLNNNIISYKNTHNIEINIKKWGWNKRTYSIEFWKNKSWK